MVLVFVTPVRNAPFCLNLTQLELKVNVPQGRVLHFSSRIHVLVIFLSPPPHGTLHSEAGKTVQFSPFIPEKEDKSCLVTVLRSRGEKATEVQRVTPVT